MHYMPTEPRALQMEGNMAGRRRWLIAALGLVLLGSLLLLDVSSLHLPDRATWGVLWRVLGAALSPALTDEAQPLWQTVGLAAWQTIIFAVVAVSLACPLGLLLACWQRAIQLDPSCGRLANVLGRACRLLIALTSIGTRSIHELFWAVILLSMMGLTPMTAVLAIAIPYAGIFTKVFGEILAETSSSQAKALRRAGAGTSAAILLGDVAVARPMLIAYMMVRFECGLRSAAVLGFFGLTTLGYHIHQTFINADYHAMWTYLYALIALVVVSEYVCDWVRRALRA